MTFLSTALVASWEVTAAFALKQGVIIHLLVRPYEIDSFGWEMLFGYVGALAALTSSYVWLGGFGFLAALGRTAVVAAAFNTGLFSSILVYRAFFHRLRRFPGPYLAKLSRFYFTRLAVKRLQAMYDIQELHAKYGDFVRVGECSCLCCPEGSRQVLTTRPRGDLDQPVVGDQGRVRSADAVQKVAVVCATPFLSLASLYYLTLHPRVYKKPQTLVRAAFPGGEAEWTYEAAKNIGYLDQILNESLRLRPPEPGGLARMTPPEGLQIDEQFIPSHTIVAVPTWTIQRDGRYWEEPLAFRPERWAMQTTEQAPWTVFSPGQNLCPGRHLFYMELRMVLSRLALQYELCRSRRCTTRPTLSDTPETPLR